MNAKELRVGNKLQKETGEVFTVLRLDNTNDVLVEEQRGLLTLEYNLFGISLTEEWLLKFGFKKMPDNWITIESFHYENDNCWIYLIERGFELELNTGDERHNLYRTYKYVHQLQNLYFALTGEELTIKDIKDE